VGKADVYKQASFLPGSLVGKAEVYKQVSFLPGLPTPLIYNGQLVCIINA
jgi:hypothetical protein